MWLWRAESGRSRPPMGQNLLQEVRGMVGWEPPALTPSGSTTVFKPRPQPPRVTASPAQSMARVQEPHSCPNRDSSNDTLQPGQNLLCLSPRLFPPILPSCIAVGGAPTYPVPTFLYISISLGTSLTFLTLSLLFASQKTWNNTKGTRSDSRKLAIRWGLETGLFTMEDPNPSGMWGTASPWHEMVAQLPKK